MELFTLRCVRSGLAPICWDRLLSVLGVYALLPIASVTPNGTNCKADETSQRGRPMQRGGCIVRPRWMVSSAL